MTANTMRFKGSRGGRKKKPETIIKLASMINDTDRSPAPAAKAAKIKMPAPPELFSKDADLEWKRVVKLLEERGILSPMYMSTLASYCNAFGMSLLALRELKKLERNLVKTTKDGNSDYQTHWLNIFNKADEKAYRLSALFGFSPNDEARMKAGSVPGKPVEAKNEFDEF